MSMFRFSVLFVALVGCSFCGRKEPQAPAPITVHVLRDPSANFAELLRQFDSQFSLTKPHLENGRPILVASSEGDSYTKLLLRVSDMPPSLLLIDAESKLPADVESLVQPAPWNWVCGAGAYIPNTVSGDERRAVGLYLRFLWANCHGTVTVDWKAELAKAKAGIKKNPKSAFWHNQAGVAYSSLGDFGDAVKELKLACKLDPSSPSNEYSLYALYKRKGMHAEQRQVLLDALEKDPQNPLGHYEFGYLLETERDWSDSLREYQTTKQLIANITGPQYSDPRGGVYDIDSFRDDVDKGIDRVSKLSADKSPNHH